MYLFLLVFTSCIDMPAHKHSHNIILSLSSLLGSTKLISLLAVLTVSFKICTSGSFNIHFRNFNCKLYIFWCASHSHITNPYSIIPLTPDQIASSLFHKPTKIIQYSTTFSFPLKFSLIVLKIQHVHSLIFPLFNWLY